MHGQVRAADLAGLGALLQLLANAGADVFPDEQLLRYVYQLAKLPTEGREALERDQDRESRGEERPNEDPKGKTDDEERRTSTEDDDEDEPEDEAEREQRSTKR